MATGLACSTATNSSVEQLSHKTLLGVAFSLARGVARAEVPLTTHLLQLDCMDCTFQKSIQLP